ncbi:MAG: cell division protein ZapB [Treponematales bacterium]
MISLEQVKLLESKVTRAIELVRELTEENAALKAQMAAEREHAEALEEKNARLRTEIDHIEEGILSTLDRLNQFEDAVERNIPSQGGSFIGAAERVKAAAAPAAPEPDDEADENAAGDGADEAEDGDDDEDGESNGDTAEDEEDEAGEGDEDEDNGGDAGSEGDEDGDEPDTGKQLDIF